MTRDITWFVYKPLYWQKGYRVDEDCCRAMVSDRFAGPCQCSRKPKHTIQGYGFCTQHAKKVQEELGISDGEMSG